MFVPSKLKPRVQAVALALALGATSFSANAELARMGPVSRAPTIGGYPTWFQDKTGITMEFCSLLNQAELDGGWCVLIPPGLAFPENFPTSYFDEHFYYIADNGLKDASVPGGGRARLVVAIEGAFANGGVVDGDQMTFGRIRVFMPTLPFDGDYRVITPFTDDTYVDQKAGDRIFVTSDVGTACINTFECTLGTGIGPFLLPSATPGGVEVPPMPDLKTAPPGTDPFYDLIVGAGASSADPGTGRKYLADPARIGPVTGSPLPNITFNNVDGSSTPNQSHNTFRIEVRAPSATHDGPVIYVSDGTNNFATMGRLMDAAIPGKVAVGRATYKADTTGAVTDLDVFATAAETVQARIPTQPQPAAVIPVLSFFDAPCTGALTIDPLTGVTTVNNPPYTVPAGVEHVMAVTGSDFWGQSQPGITPPTHVCVKDATARNAAGQVVPSYYLKNVTDDVTVSVAAYNGATNGTLTVNAVSSDLSAVLTLAGYGPAPAATPGAMVGKGAGTGLVLAGNTATVTSLMAPMARAQVVSNKGGAALAPILTATGTASLAGVPVAVNDSATMFEDCSATAALVCAAGQGVVVDLLANDTILVSGTVTNLRAYAAANPGSVTVAAQAARLGSASVVDGVLTYTPNANANGTDTITYAVSVNGQASNPAVVSINITPVNDAPVAVNDATAAVAGKPNSFNLIAKATDPDGNADVKNAVIVTWPTLQLGAQPTPVNGVITFTPSATGTFTFQVVDAGGLVSANTATGTVTVAATETIAFTKSIYTGAAKIGGAASTRWTVTGTDTVRAGQTLSIVYNNGTTSVALGGVNCATAVTPVNPKCVIGTAVVDALGNFTLDKVGTPGGLLDPNDKVTWPIKPSTIRVFSSSPVLGGSTSTGISFK